MKTAIWQGKGGESLTILSSNRYGPRFLFATGMLVHLSTREFHALFVKEDFHG
ncbi:MAG TPA: hypothetical protein VFQ54_07705 [Thermomicrobiales bacterium]|nr:hypothetical protein [Thermomicrobiales bacterium]